MLDTPDVYIDGASIDDIKQGINTHVALYKQIREKNYATYTEEYNIYHQNNLFHLPCLKWDWLIISKKI